MRIFMRNFIKRGLYLLFPVFILTACTGKDDIVLELDGRNNVQQSGVQLEGTADGQEIPGAGAVMPDGTAASGSMGVSGKGSVGTSAGTVAGENVTSVTAEGNTAFAETAAGNNGSLQAGTQTKIYVHICGAVENPGVYELVPGSRIYEGIEAAGGFCETACEDFVNLALPLQDGQRLVIPTMEEADGLKEEDAYREQWLSDVSAAGAWEAAPATAGNTDGAVSGNTDGLVNINTASEEQLSGIAGIGAGKAAAIVRYRQENGSFASIEDIMKVSGIKEGTFEKIKDKISVN